MRLAVIAPIGRDGALTGIEDFGRLLRVPGCDEYVQTAGQRHRRVDRAGVVGADDGGDAMGLDR